MIADLMAALVRANLAAAAAVLLVLALRRPARNLFGAQIAYSLWAAAPLAFVASLLPAAEAAPGRAPPPSAFAIPAEYIAVPGLAGLWLTGVIAAVALVAWSQVRFLQRARAGQAGPALVGVLCPRIVTPAGYERQFTAEERALVRAHERAHIDRHDPRVNALIALAQCLNWFNPLVHLAAAQARLDQELACDATVMARRPRDRRRYAQTMLKTQLAAAALPFGCHWASASRHPLEARIGMLKRARPSERRRTAGAAAVAVVTLAAGLGAWAAQPSAPPREPWTPQQYQVEGLHGGKVTVVMMRLSPAELARFKLPPRP